MGEVKLQGKEIMLELDQLNVEYTAINLSGHDRGDKKKEKAFDRMIMTVRRLKNRSKTELNHHNGFPQIFYHINYRGDYDDFSSAVSQNRLKSFLNIPAIPEPINDCDLPSPTGPPPRTPTP